MTQKHQHPPGFISYAKAKKKRGDGRRAKREAQGIANAKKRNAAEKAAKR